MELGDMSLISVRILCGFFSAESTRIIVWKNPPWEQGLNARLRGSQEGEAQIY